MSGKGTKSTQQRRVKGHQHVDPLSETSDNSLGGLMDGGLAPTANSGLMGIMQQLKLHDVAQTMHSPVAPTNASPVAPTTVSEDDVRRAAVVQVQKIFAEKGGDSGVQTMLQQQIQITKKKESDIAVAKKRGEAAAREKEKLTADLHRLTIAKTQLELHCKTMQSEIKKQDEEARNAAGELASNREEVRAKIQKEVQELEGKMKAMEADDTPLVEENTKLREECTALKEEFDSAFKSYETSWSSKEAETGVLIRDLQETLQRTELLDAKLLLARKEVQNMMDAIEVYKQQVATYEDRFAAFHEVSLRSDEVDRVTQMQREKLQERMTMAESEKREANDIRVKFQQEIIALKGKINNLKKKLPVAEKARASAESKVRTLQQQKGTAATSS
mmetsp:Transcript_56914/g.65211  ORF Transcript_56914/g.65211 Transcript_56914/m.65211 type:complete len:389 (-) Transcript_56914:164-1330(-)